MSKIRNLATGNLSDIAKQQHRDQYATPLNGSSVGSGGQRFYGTGKLTVENEGLYVTGTASISGTLTVAGTSRFSGQTFIYGPLEVTGDTILDGKTDIGGATKITGTLDVTGAMATKGTLSVEGVTTLKNNLNVTTGGKVTVGVMTLEPTGGGQINFQGGAISRSGTFGMLINDATRVELAAATVKLTAGNVALEVLSTGVQLSAMPQTTSAANVFWNPADKRLYYKP